MDSGSPNKRHGVLEGAVSLGALIVSNVRFLRESLAEILARAPGLHVCGQCATLAHALAAVEAHQPGIVLLDVAFPGGIVAAARLSASGPEVRVVAFAVTETEENVLAWAEAGIAGYVPDTASVDDLVALIGQISRGEQACPSRIAGSLLRRIAATARGAGPTSSSPPLTRREVEILQLVGAGLSNKDIARRLGISLSTTKSHVHSLLGKLNLQRRAEVMAQVHAAPDRALGAPANVA
jgi:two-component system nitrate/nitrite response regulator NarL